MGVTSLPSHPILPGIKHRFLPHHRSLAAVDRRGRRYGVFQQGARPYLIPAVQLNIQYSIVQMPSDRFSRRTGAREVRRPTPWRPVPRWPAASWFSSHAALLRARRAIGQGDRVLREDLARGRENTFAHRARVVSIPGGRGVRSHLVRFPVQCDQREKAMFLGADMGHQDFPGIPRKGHSKAKRNQRRGRQREGVAAALATSSIRPRMLHSQSGVGASLCRRTPNFADSVAENRLFSMSNWV